MKKDVKDVISMSESHWNYIRKLLLLHGEKQDVIDKIGWHYIQAMIHGYKHGIQDMEK